MKNDSRRYVNSKDVEKDLIPRLMKLDKYFATTRKFVMNKYPISEIQLKNSPEDFLRKMTSNPLNYFRALESEKDKQEFLQMMHRGVGMGFDKN